MQTFILKKYGKKSGILNCIPGLLIAMVIIIMHPAPAVSEIQRIIPSLPETEDLNIEFNGDSLKGFCLVLDFRTPEEKKSDIERQSLSGEVILFIHGHLQRADDGYPLTSKLAARSKSGIVIIPVCDTPFGKKSEWRGDRGKDVILMEITRYVLSKMQISVKNYKPVTDMPVRINEQVVGEPGSTSIQAELAVIGWSHGALISRRIAYAYPGSVKSLVQLAPAGFSDWGGEYCTGPACLLSNFNVESACIGLGIFRGELPYISDAGWGITKGLFGDTGRSCSSCISGNFSFFKMFRSYKDLKDCSFYADDSDLPLPGIKYITVVFAVDDTLFEYDDQGGIKDPVNVTREENEHFFEKFYPASVKSGAICTLAALPGNHIGPMVNSDAFAETALSTIGQKR
ncbi:MAG TPA: hypothetical protein PK514_00795 [Spirochaetota bacterium]|nr:hypothetical protein [Spirochaetota bacterium]